MAYGARGADPWGAAVLRRVVADLKKGWPAGLTVLTGDDLYHLDRAQQAILEHLAPASGDAFGLSYVGETAVSVGDLVGAARSAGMFASRRVVVLRDVAALEGDPEPLVAYAARPPADSFIVVRAPKLDRKRKLHKALAEAGRCLAFRQAGEAEAPELLDALAEIAKDAGVRFEREAMETLADVCGSDLQRAAVEIEKIAVWAGDRREPVTASDVAALVAGSALLTGWELADGITVRDMGTALGASRRLVDGGKEPIAIVGGVAWRSRLLLAAKGMEAAGMPLDRIVDTLRAWRFRRELATGLKRYSLAELLAAPATLYRADKTFKSRALDPRAVLESMVIDMTAPTEKR